MAELEDTTQPQDDGNVADNESGGTEDAFVKVEKDGLEVKGTAVEPSRRSRKDRIVPQKSRAELMAERREKMAEKFV